MTSTAFPRVARADGEKAVCLDAMAKGQTLRDAHKLIEARDRFRVCARQQCPAMVQQDCGGWLGELEHSVPTVVVTARSPSGNDLVDVRVTVDGQPFLASLDGQATPVNPGLHTFRLEAASADLLPVERRVLVKEGGKDQPVNVVFAEKPPPSPPPAPTPTVAISASGASGSGHSSGVRTAGWVTGAIGLAGLAAGGVFGVVALHDKKVDCSSDVCAPGTLQTIRHMATASDVGLIAGGVLAATGIGLVLFAPSHPVEAPTSASVDRQIRLVPSLTSGLGPLSVGGAGLTLRGGF